METRTRSAWLALCLAPLTVLQAILLEAMGGAWWPHWIDGIAVAVLLGLAGWLVIRETSSTRARMLSAAWGGMVLIAWNTAVRHLDALPPEADYAPDLTATSIGLALLLVISVVGLALSLPTIKRPFIGTRPPKEER